MKHFKCLQLNTRAPTFTIFRIVKSCCFDKLHPSVIRHLEIIIMTSFSSTLSLIVADWLEASLKTAVSSIYIWSENLVAESEAKDGGNRRFSL